MIDLRPFLPVGCTTCAHFDPITARTCAAFPDGIPQQIISGDFDHRQPFPNAKSPQDHGIRFKMSKDTLALADIDEASAKIYERQAREAE